MSRRGMTAIPVIAARSVVVVVAIVVVIVVGFDVIVVVRSVDGRRDSGQRWYSNCASSCSSGKRGCRGARRRVQDTGGRCSWSQRAGIR